jgi:hypothetical protein
MPEANDVKADSSPDNSGAAGATGATGVGTAGATGATGIGTTGATGVGVTGATGVGVTGATGPTGLPGRIIASNTPPVDTTVAWWRPTDGRLFVYYNDGDSSQWVEASPARVGPTGATGPGGTGSSSNVSWYFN